MNSFQKFYDRALRFLSYRPRSEKEVRDNLLRHSGKRSASRIRSSNSGQVDSGQARMTIIEQVTSKLKEQNFINDEEFAKWWIEQRTGTKPRGFRLIKIELQQKGVDKETIEKILEDYDTKIVSDEGVKRLIEKQYPKYAKLPRQEAYQKLSQFLLRRGFDWDTVKEAIDHVHETERG